MMFQFQFPFCHPYLNDIGVKAGIYCMNDHRAEVGLACDHARLACNSIKRRHDVNYALYDEMMRERMRRQ